MTTQNSLGNSGSLIERAAEMYDFRSHVSSPLAPRALASAPKADEFLDEDRFAEADPAPQFDTSNDDPFFADDPVQDEWVQAPASLRAPAAVGQRRSKVDRAGLREGGFILPDAPVGSLAEEFRIVKRQLLQAASGKTGVAEDKRQTILVCSATANEGKTFCAVNLALSMATEKDLEVLLVDGDFSKPEILSVLGLEGGPGLIDAIADPGVDPNSFIIQTDIERLSVLPAGRQANNVTELLASQRTRKVLDALTANHPRRIVIFDSPPALMASPASILAGKVGQIVMVVRADQTNEADLREAIGLLSGCDNISLMLNGTGFTASGRRFGTYYGFGQ